MRKLILLLVLCAVGVLGQILPPPAATPESLLFSQTSTVTVANTLTETSLVGTGTGSVTLPANLLIPGRNLRIWVWGFHSSTANPTITIRVKIGGVTIGTASGSSGNGTNNSFVVNFLLTCRTVGATGTIISQGQYAELHTGGLVANLPSTTTTTVNTTGTLLLDVTSQWGTANAGNTMSATNVIVEQLN